MQQYVGQAFERFKRIILDARPALRGQDNQLMHQGRDLATGEIFSATQALEFGLVDEIGFVEQAIDRAAELAGLSADEVRVIQYKAPLTLIGSLTGQTKASRAASASPAAATPWSELLQGAAPQAYYLATTLPPLLSTYDVID